MVKAKMEELSQQKLESYKTFRSSDHRPNVEEWHEHCRVTMWNMVHHDNHHHQGYNKKDDQFQPIPPRILQRPRFRLGAPALTVRQAELYGILPYYRQPTNNDGSCDNEIQQKKDIERAVIRGVRFVEGVYDGRDIKGKEVGPSWRIKDGKFCVDDEEKNTVIANDAVGDIPICLATMELATPRSGNGASVALSGQDKYLGGMASPCGRYIYGVPVRI